MTSLSRASTPSVYRPLVTQIQCPFPMKGLDLWHVLQFSTEGVKREYLHLQRLCRSQGYTPEPRLGCLFAPSYEGFGQDWEYPQGLPYTLLLPIAWVIASRQTRGQEIAAMERIAQTLYEAFAGYRIPLNQSAGALWAERTILEGGVISGDPDIAEYLGEHEYVNAVIEGGELAARSIAEALASYVEADIHYQTSLAQQEPGTPQIP